MAKIIPSDEYRDLHALRAGYSHWRNFFNDDFNARTGLSELCPATLGRLAEPGDDSTTALYSLIIGFLGLGQAETFESLDSQLQSYVLDIHLFMADQIRFEMMYRLGWLDQFIGNRFALFEMVKQFKHVKQACQKMPPQLAKDHPGFNDYRSLIDRDKQVFIRRMLSSAIEAFKSANNL
jgi:hypothetical protein